MADFFLRLVSPAAHRLFPLGRQILRSFRFGARNLTANEINQIQSIIYKLWRSCNVDLSKIRETRWIIKDPLAQTAKESSVFQQLLI